MPEDSAPPPRSRPRVVVVAHDVRNYGGMERALFELISAAHDRVDFTVVSATLAPDLQPLVRWRRVPISLDRSS